MRITKVAGLAIAGATVVGGLAIGGVAYANGAGDGSDGEPVVQIYSTEDGQSTGQPGGQYGSTADRDCPEKNGGGSSEGTTPENSPDSGSETTPETDL
jgi:hypothetical protein